VYPSGPLKMQQPQAKDNNYWLAGSLVKFSIGYFIKFKPKLAKWMCQAEEQSQNNNNTNDARSKHRPYVRD
jgi:hypothetical protein